MRRACLLAIDGLDWPLLLAGAEAGWMPHIAQMLTDGAHGRLRMPPPACASAQWATVAGGVMADVHGICHDWMPESDGLRLRRPQAADWHLAPVWQTIARAGMQVRVAGWPATGDTRLEPNAAPGSCVVAEGFQNAGPGGDLCWPLPPDLVMPNTERQTVHAARMHPGDLDDEAWAAMLDGLPPNAQHALIGPARELMARWASVHNLGVHWATQQSAPGLLALRYDGLPGWMQALRRCGVDAALGLRAWYSWLDRLLGRYRELCGPATHLIVLSNESLPPTADTRLDKLLGRCSPGGVLMAGPGVARDGLLEQAVALDIAPTVLALLGLPSQDGLGRLLPGRSLVAPSEQHPARTDRRALTAGSDSVWQALQTEPAQDTEALAWLAQHGVPAANTSGLQEPLRAARAAQLAGWAQARLARGSGGDAIEALQLALALAPEHQGLRLMLGECLLQAGRAVDLQRWAESLPPAAHEGDWADLLAGLLAFARRDRHAAEQHFLRLVDSPTSPVVAAAWLGRVLLELGDAASALPWLRLALQRTPSELVVWQALARAQAQLGQAAEAVSAWTHALALEPDNASLHLARALALEAAGEATAAAAACWRALALDAGLEEAHRALVRISRRS